MAGRRSAAARPGATGFSMIEVLIVMIIIAILAAIAIPMYLGQRDRAKDAAARAGGRQIATALLSRVLDSDADDPWPATCDRDDARTLSGPRPVAGQPVRPRHADAHGDVALPRRTTCTSATSRGRSRDPTGSPCSCVKQADFIAAVTALLVIIAAVYGLLIGSFLNAWAWRLAHHESISKGRSHCPSCGHQIRAYDNIPVLSWLLLRGRCRDCGAPISWRYPVGEAVTAALFVGIVLLDGLDWVLVPHLLFVSALVLVSQVDLEVRLIPDVVILPVAAVGVPLMILFGDGPWWEWLVAALGAAGFLFLISEVYYRVRHVEGMGFGDVKLALCMGVYLGAAVVPALFIGFLSGAVIGVILAGGHQSRRQDRHPVRAVPRRREP